MDAARRRRCSVSALPPMTVSSLPGYGARYPPNHGLLGDTPPEMRHCVGGRYFLLATS
jgi:hypothetical protein